MSENAVAYSGVGVESAPERPNAFKTIIFGGLTVGVLDGLSAVVLSAMRGISPLRVFQYIASGLLGRDSFNGGMKTALLGVLLHFVIAFGVATVFYFASLYLPVLIRKAVLMGAIYGVVVYWVMQLVVVPLSAVTRPPRTLSGVITQIIIHILFVGLPPALIAKWSAKAE